MAFKPKAEDIVAAMGPGGDDAEDATGGDLEAAMGDFIDAVKAADAKAAADAFKHALALADSEG